MSLTIETWGLFLEARRNFLLFAHSEGRTDEEIAQVVSMDAEQVRLVREFSRLTEEEKIDVLKR